MIKNISYGLIFKDLKTQYSAETVEFKLLLKTIDCN